MFRGKLAGSVLAISVAVSSFATTPATAAAKPSGKCIKLGATTRINANLYRCTKVKKNLVWKLAPTPAAAPKPVDPPRQEDPYDRFGEYAWLYKSLDRYSVTWFTAPSGPDVKILVEAEKPLDAPRQTLSDGAQFALLLLAKLSPTLPAQHFYLYDSVPWLDPRLSTTCPNLLRTVNLGSGGAGCGKYVVFDMAEMIGLSKRDQLAAPAHELFHNVQTAAAELTRSRDWYWHLPSWFREGSAQVVQGLVYSLYADSKNPRYFTYKGAVAMQNSCGAALEYWRTNDDPSGHSKTNGCEYDLGTTMMELLIAKAGSVESVLDVYKDVAGGTEFRAAIEKRYGWDFATFISELEKRLRESGWKL